MANSNRKHRLLGRISRHHLVPRQRLKDSYQTNFTMPRNILRLWRVRHDAWHALFGTRTLNETILYLKQGKKRVLDGYLSPSWHILFGTKTARQAAKLLRRMRRMVRKKYAYFELDPLLRQHALEKTKENNNRTITGIDIENRFRKRA